MPCSYHALRASLASIGEASSVAMGPLYLIRLLRLRDKRKAALDQLLLRPLRLRDDCHWRKMNSITEAYRHMAGRLVWEARADADVIHDHHWCTYICVYLYKHCRQG